MESHNQARSSRGFTLIELMIVVVIATILLSIAVPSYLNQIRQSRRTEAKQALLDIAGREERYFSTNPTGYTFLQANLGYGAAGNMTNVVVGSGYYQVSVCSPACAPSAVGAPSYSVTATPVAGKGQTNDTQCTSFSVDSTGAQFSTGTGTTAYCWSN